MKNIHILPTDKPSRLHLAYGKDYYLSVEPFVQLDTKNYKSFNIYITSDEEIKEGDWVYHKILKSVFKIDLKEVTQEYIDEKINISKIILTTNQDLIKDGIQAIDDEFLEWFVKNPSCESVEVKEKQHFEADKSKRKNPLNGVYYSYKIIIPKEEPILFESFDKEKSVVITTMGQKLVKELQSTTQEETLEEANWKVLGTKNDTFYNGAKWQQEDMIEKLEMHILINEDDWNRNPQAQFRNFIEQFKKK